MKQAFEKVASAYETVKKSVQEKWGGFKKKFEGIKTEMSQEVLSAKTPEDLIALGKKLQEQGEVLKLEEDSVKQEEAQEEALEADKNALIENAHEEALVENEKFDENKAAEKAEAEQAAHEQYVQQQAEAEEVRLTEIRTKLNGEEVIVEGVENETNKGEKISIEDRYGMNEEYMNELLQERGYVGGDIAKSDPEFQQKLTKRNEDIKKFKQVEVKLFDRVLSGEATEEEMQMAIKHAAKISSEWNIAGFHSVVPKAWYTNERIASAMADASPKNKKFIDYVKAHYPKERLLKEYKVIDENGNVHTYERE